MVTTDDEIDTFINAVHVTNSGKELAQRISIAVGFIMHLNALCFELDDRKKWDALPDAYMLAAINTAQLTVMRSTHNQDASNTKIL